MYAFFKTVFSPICIVFVFLFAGLFLLFLNKRKVTAKYLIVIGIVCLFFLGFRPFSNFLLYGLEKQFPPLADFEALSEIKHIVILTAWDSDNPTVPYTSNIGYRSSFRILEAHRIYMHLPKCKIIISGGKIGFRLMSKLLLLLGVPQNNIIFDRAENTMASAVNMKKILKGQQFILVTSAIHMPRSMNSFKKRKLDPIPAPADFSYGYYKSFHVPLNRPLIYYFPNARSIMNSNLALYEYLGLCWYNLKALYNP